MKDEELEPGEKKVYVTTPTKGKDGITRPVTRVHTEKPCPVCGQPMLVEKKIKGGPFKRAFKRWRCTDKVLCNHSEVNEGDQDLYVRHGMKDKQSGILKPYTEKE